MLPRTPRHPGGAQVRVKVRGVHGVWQQQARQAQGDATLSCVSQTHQRISSLLQEAKIQAAQVLDSLEARQA